jgi:hypothetical protein
MSRGFLEIERIASALRAVRLHVALSEPTCVELADAQRKIDAELEQMVASSRARHGRDDASR